MNTERVEIKKRKKLNPAMKWGIGVVGLLLITAIFAPVIAPYDPYELGIPYIKPCAEHILGTNDLGQDIFSELIYGTRVSLMIGVFTSVIVTVIATLTALIAGYYRGAADKIITAITNVMMGLPSLALTIGWK